MNKSLLINKYNLNFKINNKRIKKRYMNKNNLIKN